MNDNRIEKYKKYRQEILENINIGESIINSDTELKNLLKKINFNTNELSILNNENKFRLIRSYKQEQEEKKINEYIKTIIENETLKIKKPSNKEYNSHNYDDTINKLFSSFKNIENIDEGLNETTELSIKKVNFSSSNKQNEVEIMNMNIKKNNNKQINIAIDGPSGVGKSTIAKEISKRLGLVFVNTGSMYRAIALFCLENKIDIYNENDVVKALDEIKLNLLPNEEIELNNVNVSHKLFTNEISNISSVIAKYQLVRNFCVKQQQEFAKKNPGVLMEGRDIGSVVLPDAELKIFLTASPEERADRRYKQLIEKGEKNIDKQNILEEVLKRDLRDSTREFSPLQKVSDAIEIDTSNLSLEQVIDKIFLLAQKKMRG